MNEYDLILEELNERVECGELTLEEAELINDYAYDKYVIEGNAFNKLVLKNKDKIDKLRADADNAYTSYVATDADNLYYDWAKKDYNTERKINSNPIEQYKFKKLGNKFLNRYTGYDSDVTYATKGINGAYTSKHAKGYKRLKSDWMKDHGNTGLSPEEKYVDGRYKRLQDMRHPSK